MDNRTRSPQELTPFGRWLMDRLEERQMKRADLARKLDVFSGNISRWLYRSNPETDMSVRIAQALMLPLDDVLLAAGHRPAGAAGGELSREAAAILERIPEELLVGVIPMLRGLASDQAATRARLDALLAPEPEALPKSDQDCGDRRPDQADQPAAEPIAAPTQTP